MLDAEASEKEAVQKRVADTVVAGDKCQRLIGDFLRCSHQLSIYLHCYKFDMLFHC